MVKLDRMLKDVDCGKPQKGSVSVPPSLFPLVLERIAELNANDSWRQWQLRSFLANGCNDKFLGKYLINQQEVVQSLLTPTAPLSRSNEVALLIRAKELHYISEEDIDSFAEHVIDISLSAPDASYITDPRIESLVGTQRYDHLVDELERSFKDNFEAHTDEWEFNYDSDSEPNKYVSPMLQIADAIELDVKQNDLLDRFCERVAEIYDVAHPEPEYEYPREDVARAVEESSPSRSVFEDVDA